MRAINCRRFLRQVWNLTSIAVFAFALAFTLASTQARAQLAVGKDYLAITPPQPTPPGKNIEMLEFFWYACPHCDHLQPAMRAWLKNKPADVAFRNQPAAFDESWTQLARTFYALDAAGTLEKLHPEVFAAIHKSKKLDPRALTKDPKTLFAWMGDQKQDVKKFTDAYNSFSVVSKTNRTVDITSAYGVTGTPAIAIDGRYLIAPGMVPSKNNGVDYELFFKNVDQLIAMARANRKGK